MNGNFPPDIIIFAGIAAFLALRLRSALGRRTGFEQPPRPVSRMGGMPFQRQETPVGGADKGIVIEGRAEPVEPARNFAAPADDTDVGRALADIKRADPGFDIKRFMTNAERAFCTILASFTAGQRDLLRPLLTDNAYAAFDAAITAREEAGETLRCELRRVHDLTIERASVRFEGEGRIASVTLRFVTDQINVTFDKNGKPVSGVDAVAEILDLWTFERQMNDQSPVWRLAAAEIG